MSFGGTRRRGAETGRQAIARLRVPIVRWGLRALLWACRLEVDQRPRPPAARPCGLSPSGRGDPGKLVIADSRRFYRELAAHPKIAFGETYAERLWWVEGGDLAATLIPTAQRLGPLFLRAGRLRRLLGVPRPQTERNTVGSARREISAHYDLGNELFESFLDPTLTYSSALFDPGQPYPEQDLEEAQLRKIDRILDLAEVGQGTRLLEIGTGWGSLALRAAKRGAQVTTCTLSAAQAERVNTLAKERGLDHLIRIQLADYREVTGEFDSAVSVEMIEAVGEDFLPTYFTAVADLLRPAGVFALQAILVDHRRFLVSARDYGWIEKHIFPGGQIPSGRAITETAARVGWECRDELRFGPSYTETLHRWREQFCDAAQGDRRLDFDQRFLRLWELYLAYSEIGFGSGQLDVGQFQLVKKRGS